MVGETIGDRIRKMRDEKGWTQDDLARAAGISKGFLSDVENGKRNISADNVLKVANALGASLEYLLRGSTPQDEPAALVQIPPELSKAAEEMKLSYSDTLALLRTRQSIVARRGRKAKKTYDLDDWKKLYQALKSFYK